MGISVLFKVTDILVLKVYIYYLMHRNLIYIECSLELVHNLAAKKVAL